MTLIPPHPSFSVNAQDEILMRRLGPSSLTAEVFSSESYG